MSHTWPGPAVLRWLAVSKATLRKAGLYFPAYKWHRDDFSASFFTLPTVYGADPTKGNPWTAHAISDLQAQENSFLEASKAQTSETVYLHYSFIKSHPLRLLLRHCLKEEMNSPRLLLLQHCSTLVNRNPPPSLCHAPAHATASGQQSFKNY